MMGLGPRKRWGQNFLINPGARKRIVDLLEIEKGQIVWEIGPGLGAMTKDILERNGGLTAFEIDPGYCEYLSMAFNDKGLQLVPGDVLKTWEDHWNNSGAPHKILGNLPYNAASAIIGDLLEKQSIPQAMVFLVQDEMGQRMTAKVGSKNYSSFSVLCQYSCEIQDGGKLNAGSFYPAPRVASRIIRMTRKDRALTPNNWELFLKLVRGLFNSRRKTLKNNLQSLAGRGFAGGNFIAMEKVFKDASIDLGLRPERLTVDQFVLLSNGLSYLEKESHS